MSIYYNFSLTNQSSSRTLLDHNDTRRDSILDKASNYELSIVKFNLPSGEIDTFLINNDTDYAITYSCLANDNTNTNYQIVTFTQPMYQSKVSSMRSIQDFIENYNRSSLLCFKGLLSQLNSYYGNVITKTATGTSSNVGTTASVDLSFDFSTGITPANLFCSYITVTANIYGTATKQNMEFQLIDPNGISCILSAGKQYGNASITYEDGSIYNQNSVTTLTQSSYQPMETMAKFSQSTTTQKGTWKLRVFNKNSSTSPVFNFTYNVSVTISFSPFTTTMYFPRVSPILNLTDDTISFVYDDNLPRSGFQLGVSGRLYSILTFPGTTVDNLLYTLKLPQTRIANSGTLSLINYPQPLPSAFKMIDLCEVQIRSGNLPVEAEQSALDKQAILSSIDVDVSDLNNSVFQYFNQNPSERAYSLNRTTQLNEINLNVFVRYRSTNVTTPVYLPAYTTFNCLLKFSRVTPEALKPGRS